MNQNQELKPLPAFPLGIMSRAAPLRTQPWARLCGNEAWGEGGGRARCDDIQAQHTSKMQTSFLILASPTAPGAWVQLHFYHCNFEILTRVWAASFFFFFGALFSEVVTAPL